MSRVHGSSWELCVWVISFIQCRVFHRGNNSTSFQQRGTASCQGFMAWPASLRKSGSRSIYNISQSLERILNLDSWAPPQAYKRKILARNSQKSAYVTSCPSDWYNTIICERLFSSWPILLKGRPGRTVCSSECSHIIICSSRNEFSLQASQMLFKRPTTSGE